MNYYKIKTDELMDNRIYIPPIRGYKNKLRQSSWFKLIKKTLKDTQAEITETIIQGDFTIIYYKGK